jgi:transketolase
MGTLETELEKKAREVRLNILRMVGPEQTGHFGGSCSCADIVTALYFWKMKKDPANPSWEDRDRFLLSKGHAALAQYAALAMNGYFPESELETLKQLGSRLQGHPDLRRLPGIEANTGSLGQGLSIAAGMAAGAKLSDKKYKVYCIIGDGEMSEGQIWEAAMAAKNFRLDNLVVFLDSNKLQATGRIADRFDTTPVREKWEAFGWNTVEIDGHDMGQIIGALNIADRRSGRPTMIIANTIKGKGIKCAENAVSFHNGKLTREQFGEACRELGA